MTHNEAGQRFEAETDAGTAVLDYRLREGVLVLTHTKVPEEVEGRGIGSALVDFALDHARREKLSVDPQCPFVAAYIEEHPEHADLVA